MMCKFSLYNLTIQLNLNSSYFLTELMDHDLAELIRSSIEFTDDIIKFIIYQLLRGIKYIHSAKIIHRDLVKFFHYSIFF